MEAEQAAEVKAKSVVESGGQAVSAEMPVEKETETATAGAEKPQQVKAGGEESEKGKKKRASKTKLEKMEVGAPVAPACKKITDYFKKQ